MEQPERTIWHEMVGQLGPMAERAFLKRWGKNITFHARHVPVEGGRTTLSYGFRFDQPGLLPTQMEREWFTAYVTGYQGAFNLMLAMIEPVDRGEPS